MFKLLHWFCMLVHAIYLSVRERGRREGVGVVEGSGGREEERERWMMQRKGGRDYNRENVGRDEEKQAERRGGGRTGWESDVWRRKSVGGRKKDRVREEGGGGWGAWRKCEGEEG